MMVEFQWTDNEWVNSLRNWDWDLWDLWDHWMDTAWYYLDTIGWPAYLGLFLFVVFVGLSLDLTHQWTSNMLSRSWGAVGDVVMTMIGLVLSWLGLMVNRFFFARIRDSVRMFRDYRKNRPN